MNPTAQFLRRYNAWRRGDEELTMENPTEIGKAIDTACALIEQRDELLDALIGCLDQSSNGLLSDEWREIGVTAIAKAKGEKI